MGMLGFVYEIILWASLTAIMGTCIYLSPGFGLMVMGTGIFWIARVLKRVER